MGAFIEFQRKRLSELTAEDINGLVKEKISESLYIDFKRDYNRSAEWIPEILKDIKE
jgi:hypothetical protein